jgi:tetratricopeptide (TPR) repeat protein
MFLTFFSIPKIKKSFFVSLTLCVASTLASTLASTPLQAKIITYRSEAEVQITHEEDYALAFYLAQQAAKARAYTQAEPLILQLPFLKGVKLSPAERYAVFNLLASDILNYTPSDANTPLYKYKLTYDTLKFPEKYIDYQMQYVGEIMSVGYEWSYDQALQSQIVDYLSRINAIRDENAARFLRVTEGKKLFSAIKAQDLRNEAYTYHREKKYEKALALTEQAIQLEPDYIGHSLMKLSILIGQFKAEKNNQKLDEALKTAGKLIEKYPTDPYTHFLRASLYLYQDVIPEQGLKDMEQAIALKKDAIPPVYYLVLGSLAQKSGKLSQSQDAFAKSCALGLTETCNASVKGKIELN